MTMQCIACEQALHLGDIVKSRRARGDAKAGVAGEKGFPRPLAYSPFARVFSRGSLHSPKKKSLLAGYAMYEHNYFTKHLN